MSGYQLVGKKRMTKNKTNNEENLITGESFEELFLKQSEKDEKLVGSVIKGTVLNIEKEMIIVDVGYKAEGRIPIREFMTSEEEELPKIGDLVDVYLERVENKFGEAVLSREKARREEAWSQLEIALDKKEKVTGTIFGRVKGGFTVDLGGAIAFLPGSQVDVRPTRDLQHLVGSSQPFHLLKMDRRRGNIVVSRRSVLEENRAEAKAELVSNIKEGQVLEGIVKNITDYGAFIDLGDADGLLHVTDISWRRINNPNEELSVGQKIKVQVIKFNPDTQRISLGMKQLEEDPWLLAKEKYKMGTKATGRVTNITDYGAFVEIESGIEGLVHVSEMSWTRKNMQPGKIVSTSEEVEVMILELDKEKRRISLGMKQCQENPWKALKKDFKIGQIVEGEVKSITEFGLFINLAGDLDGLIHLSDLDWSPVDEEYIKKYKKGDIVKAKLLEIDIVKERVSLGIKQLTKDPISSREDLKKGKTATCVIKEITNKEMIVDISKGVRGIIKKSELAKDRSEQRLDRFALGEKVDARIMSVDLSKREVILSIKQLEVEVEKKALKQYGSADSGASLGDILGAALEKAQDKKVDKEKSKPSKPSKEMGKKEAEVKKKAKNSKKESSENKSKTDNSQDSKSKSPDDKTKNSKSKKKLSVEKKAKKK